MSVVTLFKHGKRFRFAPSFNYHFVVVEEDTEWVHDNVEAGKNHL